MTNSWSVRGGKSGASFSKSLDDRFVIKVINRVEMQMFIDFAPAYFGKLFLMLSYLYSNALLRIYDQSIFP